MFDGIWEVTEPDRTAFWRDAEAARLTAGDVPKLLEQRIAALCQAQAITEAHGRQDSTQATLDAYVRSTARSLIQECRQRGYCDASASA